MSSKRHQCAYQYKSLDRNTLHETLLVVFLYAYIWFGKLVNQRFLIADSPVKRILQEAAKWWKFSSTIIRVSRFQKMKQWTISSKQPAMIWGQSTFVVWFCQHFQAKQLFYTNSRFAISIKGCYKTRSSARCQVSAVSQINQLQSGPYLLAD